MSDLHRDPSTWGRPFWKVLHIVAHTYPEHPNAIAKRKYYDLIQNIPVFLPGEAHGRDFERLLNRYPVTPYLDSRESFIRWANFIHNRVNAALGKPQMSLAAAEGAYVRCHGGLPEDSTIAREAESARWRMRKGWCCSLGILLALVAAIGT